jgi:hypothetical protein
MVGGPLAYGTGLFATYHAQAKVILDPGRVEDDVAGGALNLSIGVQGAKFSVVVDNLGFGKHFGCVPKLDRLATTRDIEVFVRTSQTEQEVRTETVEAVVVATVQRDDEEIFFRVATHIAVHNPTCIELLYRLGRS